MDPGLEAELFCLGAVSFRLGECGDIHVVFKLRYPVSIFFGKNRPQLFGFVGRMRLKPSYLQRYGQAPVLRVQAGNLKTRVFSAL